MSLERSVHRSSDSSERRAVHELFLEPKDHTHQVTSRCAIAFVRAKYMYGDDLILADFNLAVGWSIRQTTKFIFQLYSIWEYLAHPYLYSLPTDSFCSHEINSTQIVGCWISLLGTV
jgi:hypothetical protein